MKGDPTGADLMGYNAGGRGGGGGLLDYSIFPKAPNSTFSRVSASPRAPIKNPLAGQNRQRRKTREMTKPEAMQSGLSV